MKISNLVLGANVKIPERRCRRALRKILSGIIVA